MDPTFLVIGAMKAGSSSLHRFLGSHPQVFMSEWKELNFFVEERNWERGIKWYREQFADAGDALAVGESSVAYSMHPIFQGVPSRIAQTLPNVKLIYLVRHPIERMRSHYLHMYYKSQPKKWERDPMEAEHRRIEQVLLTDPQYVPCSSYGYQLSLYLQYFSPEQILVLTSEELRHDRPATLRKAFDFLGVDPCLDRSHMLDEFNRSDEKRKLRPFARTLLRVPGRRVARNFVPQSMKDQLFKRSIDPKRSVIPDALRLQLEDLLRDDVRQLRAFTSNGFDGWGIG